MAQLGKLQILILSSLMFFSPMSIAQIDIQKGIQLVGGKQNQQFFIKNSINQQQYQIQIFQPKVAAPSDGFSVIYMLDGNASFPYASVMAQAGESRFERHGNTPPIIVAIGYPIDGTVDVKSRTYDYTPPFQGEFKAAANRPAPDYPQGGAEQFFQFIELQLKPIISSHYKINQNNQTLFGHSYGGLFTLYTFLNHPESFQNFFAASPSIWWNDSYLLKQVNNSDYPQKTLKHRTNLWLSVGELEINRSNTASIDIPDIERFKQQLNTLPTLNVKTHIIPQASHFEAMFPAINLALKLAQNIEQID